MAADPSNPPQLISSTLASELHAIARIRGSKRPDRGGCTAVLITTRFALTAAHCSGPNGRGKRILVFDPAQPDRGHLAKIERVTRHPDYEGEMSFSTAYADFAVLELAEDLPADLVQPISVATDIDFQQEHAIIGYKNPGNPPLVGHVVCAVVQLEIGLMGSDCTVQSGMSGSPVLARRGETWVVVGITVATVPKGLGPLRALITEIDEGVLREAGLDLHVDISNEVRNPESAVEGAESGE